MYLETKICDFCDKKYEIFPNHKLDGFGEIICQPNIVTVTINGVLHKDVCNECVAKILKLKRVV